MTSEEDECTASADGIRECLRLLADEASALKLSGTRSAIERAMAVMLQESTHGSMSPDSTAPRWFLH